MNRNGDAVALESAQDLIVEADHGQIYIYAYGGQGWLGNPFLDALDDAVSSRRFVGLAAGLIDLKTPGQWNSRTPLRLEIHSTAPDVETARWDHAVELDFDCDSGKLIFEASGGGRPIRTEIPAGRYRVRISGGGYGALGAAGANGNDQYLMQCWPRTAESPAALLKYWRGWDSYR